MLLYCFKRVSALHHDILNTSSSKLPKLHFELWWRQFKFAFFFPSPCWPCNCFLLAVWCVLVETCQRDLPLTHCRQLTDLKCCGVRAGSSLFANSPEWDGWQSETPGRSAMFCFTANNTDGGLGNVCAGDSRWLAMRTTSPSSLNTEPTLGCIWFIVFGCRMSCTLSACSTVWVSEDYQSSFRQTWIIKCSCLLHAIQ